MNLKLFLVLILVPLTSFAQLSFEQAVISGEDDFLVDADIIMTSNNDMDGDGDLDLIVHSFFQIGWYENLDGLGKYSSQKLIARSFQFGINYAEAADMDSDGDTDIVFLLGNGDDLFWVENLDGLGNFGPEILIDSASIYTGLKLSDLDGDGDQDILVDSNSQGISWYENLGGSGNFAMSSIIIPANSTIFRFYSIDVDADGDIDILYRESMPDELLWFENIGNVNFSAAQVIASGTGNLSKVQRTDIDGDNDVDLVATISSTIYWFENINNQGTFTTTVMDQGNGSISSANIFDLDGDTDTDILVYRNTGRLEYYENLDGLGTLGSPVLIEQDQCFPSCTQGRRVNSIDADGDGFSDVILSKSSTNTSQILWFRNINGTGAFEERRPVSELVGTVFSMRSFDMDNDGDLDLFTQGVNLSYFKNINGSGVFDRQEFLNFENSIIAFSEIDVENDGDLDIVAFDQSASNDIVWFENVDGAGTYSSAQFIDDTFTFANDLVVGDIDGDSFNDIALVVDATMGSGEQIVWFRNLNGSGNFSGPNSVGINGVTLRTMKLADIDSDGDLDIFANSSLSNDFLWHENQDGNGTFGAANLIPGFLSFQGFDIGDMDGDGDLDIIGAGNGVGWIDNLDGFGNFGPQINIGNPAGVESTIFLSDIDGDQDLDAVVNTINGDGVVWFENLDSNGNFGSENLVGTSTETFDSGLVINDLNGDFKPDVAYVDRVMVGLYEPFRVMQASNLGETGNQIIGEVNYDLDGSGCGGSDPFVPNLMISTTDGVNTYSTFTLPNGFYSLNVGEGVYTTTVSTPLPTHYTASPEDYVFNFTGIGNTEIADFCVEPEASISDAEIQLFPVGVARPGFSSQYTMVYRNFGTTVLDGEVSIAFDESLMEFDSASEAPSEISPGSLVFDFTDLNPFEIRSIQITFTIESPPVVNDGDTLIFEAVATPAANDDFPENNEFILEQIVVNSFDPNDIIVLEGESIPINNIENDVHYLIRFQNIGSASAINVLVTNTLDENLDWGTLQILDTSHQVEVQIENGQEISFFFNGINLPSSMTNEELSKGYISYKIKPLPSLEIGDSFSNNAEIFFDFNPPIATNTVVTTIVEELGIISPELGDCLSAPNPTEGILEIRCDLGQINQALVMDVHGRIVIQKNDKKGIFEINLKELSTGLYYVRLVNNDGVSSIHKVLKK